MQETHAHTPSHTYTHTHLHTHTMEYYPLSCIHTSRDMCSDMMEQNTKESHSNTDTLINQVSQMNRYAEISTSGNIFKASTAQWVP